MKTVEEGWELLRMLKSGEAHFEYYWLDSVCMCVFENYNDGYMGMLDRRKAERMGAYAALAKVNTFEDFQALIARLKLEMNV